MALLHGTMVPLQIEYAPDWLTSMLTSELGYAVLLGICVLEGVMMLRFMPSELVVPLALALLGSSVSDVFGVVTVAVVGTTIGQTVLFFLVRRTGREYLFEKRWFPLTESRLERFDGWFDRWGPLAVAVSNTMLVVRGVLTVPAGLSDMGPRKFVALSALGSTSFQSILAGLYLLGGHLLVF